MGSPSKCQNTFSSPLHSTQLANENTALGENGSVVEQVVEFKYVLTDSWREGGCRKNGHQELTWFQHRIALSGPSFTKTNQIHSGQNDRTPSSAGSLEGLRHAKWN